MSIELYLAVNLLADCALLSTASWLLGLFDWRRVLAGGTICAVYASLAACSPVPWASVPVQICLLFAVSALVAPRVSLRTHMTLAITLMCAAALCGGTTAFIPHRGQAGTLAGFFLGVMLPIPVFAARPPGTRSWQVRLRIVHGGKAIRFPALIDTGNRLREPRSGSPVLIAEASLLKGMLPEQGYRVIAYGAVGGNGSMACFKPDGLWIEWRGRLRRAPDIWIAIAPGPLPGAYQALAPPEFVLCNH